MWPRDLLMQPIRTIWTTLVGDHPGTIPVECGQIPISGSKEEVVWIFPYIIQCKIVTPQGGFNFDPRGIIWTTLGEDLYMMLYTKYKSSGPCSFRQDFFFLKIAIWKPIFDPVTYLCNQSEPFDQFRWRNYQRTIPVEFGRIPISGSREEVVWTFPYIIQCEARTLNYSIKITEGNNSKIRKWMVMFLVQCTSPQ